MTFLEQLQESAGLLNNKIKDTDTTQIKSLFGNYNPNLASDYVATPFGQPIAQNRFLGNQFQMPNLSGQTYTPGAMAPRAGFNFGNMGTFTPGAFNQYGNIPVTGNIPSNVSTTTRQEREGGGGGQPDNQRYSYETLNGRTFKIDSLTGKVEEANMPFGTASLLGGLFNAIPGVEDYRLANMTPENRQALQMANAQAINKEMTTNPEARRIAAEEAFAKIATPEELTRLANIQQVEAEFNTEYNPPLKSDPSRSRQDTAKGRAESRAGTNKARDDASRSTGVGRGFMGGR